MCGLRVRERWKQDQNPCLPNSGPHYTRHIRWCLHSEKEGYSLRALHLSHYIPAVSKEFLGITPGSVYSFLRSDHFQLRRTGLFRTLKITTDRNLKQNRIRKNKQASTMTTQSHKIGLMLWLTKSWASSHWVFVTLQISSLHHSTWEEHSLRCHPEMKPRQAGTIPLQLWCRDQSLWPEPGPIINPVWNTCPSAIAGRKPDGF